MAIQLEFILLGLAILFLISILAGKAIPRFGVPALLLFLSEDMLASEATIILSPGTTPNSK